MITVSGQVFVGTPGILPQFAAQGQPSTKNGEWPHYNARHERARATRRSIRSTPRTSASCEVAWRFKTDALRPVPGIQARRHAARWSRASLYATAGTRRSVIALDAQDRRADLVAQPARRASAPASRRGSCRDAACRYWTDGRGDERIVYVTTGYRLVELNAKTGALIAVVRQGRHRRSEGRRRARQRTSRSISRPARSACTRRRPSPSDVAIIGSSFREGATVKTHDNTKGWCAPSTCAPARSSGSSTPFRGRASSAARRGRTIVGANGNVGVWSEISVDEDLGLVYLPVETPTVRLLRRPSARQQPVCREPGLRRSEDRAAQVALPVRASPGLELRHVVGADARRHHRERTGDQGGRRSEQGGVPLRLRSRARASPCGRSRSALCRSRRCRARRPRRRSRSRPSRPPTRGNMSRCPTT